MFTVDTVVDQNVKTAKVFSGFIPNSKYREQLNKLIDSQAEFAKSWYESVVTLNKTLVETNMNVK